MHFDRHNMQVRIQEFYFAAMYALRMCYVRGGMCCIYFPLNPPGVPVLWLHQVRTYFSIIMLSYITERPQLSNSTIAIGTKRESFLCGIE